MQEKIKEIKEEANNDADHKIKYALNETERHIQQVKKELIDNAQSKLSDITINYLFLDLKLSIKATEEKA